MLPAKYKLGSKGFKLITEFESLRLESYLDPVGIWTIGYGTTMLNGSSVTKNMRIGESVAVALFTGEINTKIEFIGKIVTVSLNQNQVDALASLVYNIGTTGFANSTLLAFINAKSIIIEDLFTRWNKGRVNGKLVVLNGLTRRRKAEFELFMRKEL